MADIKMNGPEESPDDKLYRERAEKRASQEVERERARSALERKNNMTLWDLQDEHGHDRVARVDMLDGTMFVVVAPSADEYKRMRDLAQRKKDGRSAEELTHKCIKAPVGAELTKALGKFPGAMLSLSSAMVRLAGFVDDEEGKG